MSDTYFGFKKVSFTEKTAGVRGVFSSVANRYDLMNDLMSFGLHRLWKQQAISACNVKTGDTVVDLAGGTGDMARSLARKIKPTGKVILADLNYEMLTKGRENNINKGFLRNIEYLQCNGEAISLKSNSVDCICISFGFRNVSRQDLCLAEMYRILKPGGKLVILEFAKVTSKQLETIYELYSFKILPFMGKIITNDSDSYKYLAESIKMHPDPDKVVTMMERVGFSDCEYKNLSAGICAIHQGYKY